MVYLGIKNNRCCIIDSPVELTQANFEKYWAYCICTSTNWCGSDSVDRTCRIRQYSFKDADVIKLHHEYRYVGTDYDWGHEYPFSFVFDKIVRVDML